MKSFITQCTVGSLQTEADGNSKKLSKRRAAELMLAELKKMPQLPAIISRPKTKPAANKKKNRNLIKVSEVKLFFVYFICCIVLLFIGPLFKMCFETVLSL